jgi:peroxiredoxin
VEHNRAVDDGALDHLPGRAVPSLPLVSHSGSRVDLSALPGRTIVYVHPMIGHPDQDPPAGWDTIPGARGCTPQSCAFRDHDTELTALGATVFGLSAQSTAEQQEAARRLRLPFELLSDARLEFAHALDLPTFETGGRRFIRRLTLVLGDGQIEHVLYPVFPPEANAAEVIEWLREHPPKA